MNGSFFEKGLEQWRSTAGAVLLDVRTKEEYDAGHPEGSKNIPLSEIEDILSQYPDREKAIFVYCRSGIRALKAVSVLKGMGYRRVVSLGGIQGYQMKNKR